MQPLPRVAPCRVMISVCLLFYWLGQCSSQLSCSQGLAEDGDIFTPTATPRAGKRGGATSRQGAQPRCPTKDLVRRTMFASEAVRLIGVCCVCGTNGTDDLSAAVIHMKPYTQLALPARCGQAVASVVPPLRPSRGMTEAVGLHTRRNHCGVFSLGRQSIGRTLCSFQYGSDSRDRAGCTRGSLR